MKVNTFQGTEEELDTVLQPLSLLPASQSIFLKKAIRSNLNDLLKETRVYLIDAVNPLNITDEEFMDIAEEEGTVYSLGVFQEAYNNGLIIEEDTFIRFITA